MTAYDKPVLQGTAGEPLAPGQLATALQGHEMFLYFGHGSGDQYLSARYPVSCMQYSASFPPARKAFYGKRWLGAALVTVFI